MNPPDTPRQATRRRVRCFMAASVLAVLAVGFWPVTGFSIRNGDDFVDSIDQASFYCRALDFEAGQTFPAEGGDLLNTPSRPNTVMRVEYMPPAVMLWREKVTPFLRKHWP